MMNSGSTKLIVSGVVWMSAVVMANVNDTAEATDVNGLPRVKMLVLNTGTAVCVEIAIVSALMSDTAANVTATVRPARFAAWAFAPVLTPVATDTIHS